ncbi:MAG: hypothetical protein EPN50_05045 [Chloroflexota bacterium]|nr:MAG: hypothetical protein EPN50_05045 [Chloroflexota bacterium]
MTATDTKAELLARLAELDEREAERQRLNAAQAAWADERSRIRSALEPIEEAERAAIAVLRLDAEADAAEARARELDAQADTEATALAAATVHVERIADRLDSLRTRANEAARQAEQATSDGADDAAVAARQLAGALITQADALAPGMSTAQRVQAAHRERLDTLRDAAEAQRDLAEQRAWQALVDPFEQTHPAVPTINGLLGPVECWRSAAAAYRKVSRSSFVPDDDAIAAMADRHGRVLGYADAATAWRATYHVAEPVTRSRRLRRLIPAH